MHPLEPKEPHLPELSIPAAAGNARSQIADNTRWIVPLTVLRQLEKGLINLYLELIKIAAASAEERMKIGNPLIM